MSYGQCHYFRAITDSLLFYLLLAVYHITINFVLGEQNRD